MLAPFLLDARISALTRRAVRFAELTSLIYAARHVSVKDAFIQRTRFTTYRCFARGRVE